VGKSHWPECSEIRNAPAIVLKQESEDKNLKIRIEFKMKRGMTKPTLAGLLLVLCMLGSAVAQRDLNSDPTADVSFLILKEENGKPVRNAAVIVHPVNARGQQGRGGFELKTDPNGKTGFEGIPYGKLRVQVLASGFQTFGEDYDVDRAKIDITIKLKNPRSQYSIYPDHADEKKPDKDDRKEDKPPTPDPNAKPQ
jgi:hypothetical protein